MYGYEECEGDERCFVCRAHGDDWMFDGEGNQIKACDECYYNPDYEWEDD